MDRSKFSNTFMPYYEAFYWIAFRMLGNASDAEDAVQELYCKLWKIAMEDGKLDGLNSPEAFGKILIRRQCVDILRLRRRGLGLDDVSSCIAIEGCDFETEDTLKAVREVISKMAPMHQELFNLFYIKGLSIKEISEITGLTSINIRVSLNRIRNRIRKWIN